MNKQIKSKKGEKLLSIWWFFVLAVIAGGIVVGVLIYSTADVNIKEVDAGILSGRIADCLIDNGYLKENIFNEGFNIFDFCNLNKKVFGKNSNFYFNVSIYGSGSLIFNLTKGSYSFEEDCRISMSPDIKKAEHFPKCSERQESALFENKNVKIIILTGSNQNGRKISVV